VNRQRRKTRSMRTPSIAFSFLPCSRVRAL
jgi:hypothetical protein